MEHRLLWLVVILTIAGLGCGEIFVPAAPTNCNIPDSGVIDTFAQCTTQTINIPKSGIITAVRVGFQISHPFASDVMVALLPPGKLL